MAGIRKIAVASSGGSGISNDQALGAIFVDTGKLTPEQVERVLRVQGEEGVRFGDAAVKLGLLTPADIEIGLARQFGFYQHPALRQTPFSTDLVTACAPFTRQAEAFRAVRTQLAMRWLDDHLNKTVAIASSDRAEGRSSLAANLGVAFSQSGKRTLVVDADLRSPRQHRLFGIDQRVGLSTLLRGQVGLEAIQPIAGFSKLSVLPAGATPPDPAELLSRDTFERLRVELNELFDIVIFDTPPATISIDAQIIAACAGAALLVARRHATRTSSLQALAANLASVKAIVVGTVLNEF